MRILAFSDWRIQDISHIYHLLDNKLNYKVDFIIYAGDDINRFKERSINHFSELAKKTTQKKVLVVIGNDEDPIVKKVLDVPGVYDLHEKPFTFKKWAFLGLEGSTKGPAIVKYTEKQVLKHLEDQYNSISGKDLIIVSHTPPEGILDMGIRFGVSHIGSRSLRGFIQLRKPKLVICGHCHSHGGLSKSVRGTRVCNVSSHDSPGSVGNFAIINIKNGKVNVKWRTSSWIASNSVQKLYQIGPSKSELLESIGINNIQNLVDYDASRIPLEVSLSEKYLLKLKMYARSFLTKKVIQKSPFELNHSNIIYFDIETDLPNKRVWMIGMLYKKKFTQLYANTWRQEKRILKEFIKYLKNIDKPVLYSYSCKNFDKRVLSSALKRNKLDSKFFDSIPHHDIGRHLEQTFIFPVQRYALKKVGKFLKYPFKHEDLDGLFVALEYEKHLKDRKRLPEKIFDYNKDDVLVIPHIIEVLRTGKGIKLERLSDLK